jgi:hypothetical protein
MDNQVEVREVIIDLVTTNDGVKRKNMPTNRKNRLVNLF